MNTDVSLLSIIGNDGSYNDDNELIKGNVVYVLQCK